MERSKHLVVVRGRHGNRNGLLGNDRPRDVVAIEECPADWWLGPPDQPGDGSRPLCGNDRFLCRDKTVILETHAGMFLRTGSPGQPGLKLSGNHTTLFNPAGDPQATPAGPVCLNFSGV